MGLHLGKAAYDLGDQVLLMRATLQVKARMHHDAHTLSAPLAEFLPRQIVSPAHETGRHSDLRGQAASPEPSEKVTIRPPRVVEPEHHDWRLAAAHLHIRHPYLT